MILRFYGILARKGRVNGELRHVIDFSDVALPEWQELYKLAEGIWERPGDYRDALRGRVMASLFFEPSTRSCFSFQAAMQRLGGGVFGFSDPSVTSVTKGETLKDTIIMASGYADAIVMRHPREGAALAASLYSSCPVINAGDGGHMHPTQSLTDLATLTRLRGGVDGLHIGMCGDLRYGRAVHSLIRALSAFEGVRLTLISPPELRVPSYLRRFIARRGMPFEEVTQLEEPLKQLDVLYMTRVQKERFPNPQEYERHKGVYVLTTQKLKAARPDLLILHPLPRVDEIHPEVDGDPRAVYFQQAEIGMTIRMALLLSLARLPKAYPPRTYLMHGMSCPYQGCITAFERYLPPLSEDGLCRYCDHSLEDEQMRFPLAAERRSAP
jgi:aspartate carbamoyltransferase catalytic subunit